MKLLSSAVLFYILYLQAKSYFELKKMLKDDDKDK